MKVNYTLSLTLLAAFGLGSRRKLGSSPQYRIDGPNEPGRRGGPIMASNSSQSSRVIHVKNELF
jgi:hypothetical protein